MRSLEGAVAVLDNGPRHAVLGPDHQNSPSLDVTQPTGSRTYGLSGGSSRSAKVCQAETGTEVKHQQSVSASSSEHHRSSGSWFVTVLPVADPQLVGQIVTAVATVLGSGGAAFWGARAANRNTEVVDARAQKTTDMEVARQMFAMALSNDTKEAEAAAYVLREMKDDFIADPVLRKFVIRAVTAVTAAERQAYHGGATHVTTTPPPGGTAGTP